MKEIYNYLQIEVTEFKEDIICDSCITHCPEHDDEGCNGMDTGWE